MLTRKSVAMISVLLLFLSVMRTPHVIQLTAGSDDRFALQAQADQTLHVKAGESLLFRVTAQQGSSAGRDAAVHSLVIRSLREQGWDVRLKAGFQEIALQAPTKPGMYLIECTVPCGPGHGSMNLQMAVEP